MNGFPASKEHSCSMLNTFARTHLRGKLFSHFGCASKAQPSGTCRQAELFWVADVQPNWARGPSQVTWTWPPVGFHGPPRAGKTGRPGAAFLKSVKASSWPWLDHPGPYLATLRNALFRVVFTLAPVCFTLIGQRDPSKWSHFPQRIGTRSELSICHQNRPPAKFEVQELRE